MPIRVKYHHCVATSNGEMAHMKWFQKSFVANEIKKPKTLEYPFVSTIMGKALIGMALMSLRVMSGSVVL